MRHHYVGCVPRTMVRTAHPTRGKSMLTLGSAMSCVGVIWFVAVHPNGERGKTKNFFAGHRFPSRTCIILSA